MPSICGPEAKKDGEKACFRAEKRIFVEHMKNGLSILIPTYNDDCSALVAALSAQACQSGASYEIIVGDDGSTAPAVTETPPLPQLEIIRMLYACEVLFNEPDGYYANDTAAQKHNNAMMIQTAVAEVLMKNHYRTLALRLTGRLLSASSLEPTGVRVLLARSMI